MKWSLFCKRTEDPKLTWIEGQLTQRGIPNRRNGSSFHAPILEVADDRLEEAHMMLQEKYDGRVLDDIEDDDPMFLPRTEEIPIPVGYVAVEGGYLLRDPNYKGPVAGDEDPSGTGQDDDC